MDPSTIIPSLKEPRANYRAALEGAQINPVLLFPVRQQNASR
jgi:hypothetical protein